MPTQYPAGIDNFTQPIGTQTLAAGGHTAQHVNANDAIRAIQQTLGVNPHQGYASVAARLAAAFTAIANLEGGSGGGDAPVSHGPNSARPAEPVEGQQYFSTTLRRSLFFIGGRWVDTDGAVYVFPEEALAPIVNSAAEGTTLFLNRNDDGSVATYELGTTTLTPANRVRITAPAVGRTLYSSEHDVYYVNPWVHIHGTGDFIFNLDARRDVTIENVHFGGAVFSGTGNTSGTGAWRGENITFRWCKVSDCENQGIGGKIRATVDHVEITGCGAAAIGGSMSTCAAMKSTEPCVINSGFAHHNHYYGWWADCDNMGWRVTNTIALENFASGFFYEISRGHAYVGNCAAIRNNQSNVAGRGGMIISSSKNVHLFRVKFDGNLVNNLRAWEDGRFQNGPNSCQSGYYLQNILIEECAIVSGEPFKINFRDQSAILVAGDSMYRNPHVDAPEIPGGGTKVVAVTLLNCEYAVPI